MSITQIINEFEFEGGPWKTAVKKANDCPGSH